MGSVPIHLCGISRFLYDEEYLAVFVFQVAFLSFQSLKEDVIYVAVDLFHFGDEVSSGCHHVFPVLIVRSKAEYRCLELGTVASVEGFQGKAFGQYDAVGLSILGIEVEFHHGTVPHGHTVSVDGGGFSRSSYTEYRGIFHFDILSEVSLGV